MGGHLARPAPGSRAWTKWFPSIRLKAGAAPQADGRQVAQPCIGTASLAHLDMLQNWESKPAGAGHRSAAECLLRSRCAVTRGLLKTRRRATWPAARVLSNRRRRCCRGYRPGSPRKRTSSSPAQQSEPGGPFRTETRGIVEAESRLAGLSRRSRSGGKAFHSAIVDPACGPFRVSMDVL